MWCYTATYSTHPVTACEYNALKSSCIQRPSVLYSMAQTAAVVCDLWLHVSDKLDTDDQELHNYFRQASVNLEEILKNPGVWDPFILSYTEVSTRPHPPGLIT